MSLLLVCFGCNKKPTSQVVARVGDAQLTLDDLSKTIPSQYSDSITREQNIEYITQWISDQVLYQEALRQKIDREKSFRDRLASARSDLLRAELINLQINAFFGNTVTDSKIEEWFNGHRESFVRDKDVFKYLEIVVADQKTAWQVNQMIMASPQSFEDLAKQYSIIPLADAASARFLPLDAIDPLIAVVISTIKVGGTTTPIQTASNWHIVRVLDKQKAGTLCELPEVHDQIYSELSARAQQDGLRQYIETLKLKMDIEFYPDRIPASAEGQQSTTISDSVTIAGKDSL